MPTPDQDSPFARIPIDERTAATPLGRTLIKLREYNPTLEEREALRKASGQVVGRCFVGAGVGGFLANYVARQRKWSFRPRLAVSVASALTGFYVGGVLAIGSAARTLFEMQNSEMMDLVRNAIKEERMRQAGIVDNQSPTDNDQWARGNDVAPSWSTEQSQTSDETSFPRTREDWKNGLGKQGTMKTNKYGDVIE